MEAGNWYDGYPFMKFRHLYNPKSVVEAMPRHRYFNCRTIREACDARKVPLWIHLGYLAR